jgi:DNA-binding transcriptional LysR family regulator
MEFRSLRYFVAVVNAGSFNRAADELHISQPTLSKAVTALEEEVGVTLIERGRRGVRIRMTPAGEVTFRHACALLDRREVLRSDLAAMQALEVGELALGVAPLGGAEIFAPILAKFRQAYPGIAVNMVQSGSQKLEAYVLDGSLELATTLLPLREEFDCIPLRDDAMAVLMPTTFAAAQKTQLLLGDLADVPLVMFDETFVISRTLRDAFREEGIPLREVTSIAHLDFALALIAAEAGALILPTFIAHQVARKGMTVVPLNYPGLRWKLVLAWRRGVTLSWAAQAWLHIVKTHFL